MGCSSGKRPVRWDDAAGSPLRGGATKPGAPRMRQRARGDAPRGAMGGHVGRAETRCTGVAEAGAQGLSRLVAGLPGPEALALQACHETLHQCPLRAREFDELAAQTTVGRTGFRRVWD